MLRYFFEALKFEKFSSWPNFLVGSGSGSQNRKSGSGSDAGPRTDTSSIACPSQGKPGEKGGASTSHATLKIPFRILGCRDFALSSANFIVVVWVRWEMGGCNRDKGEEKGGCNRDKWEEKGGCNRDKWEEKGGCNRDKWEEKWDGVYPPSSNE
jgi:hypothetical protein